MGVLKWVWYTILSVIGLGLIVGIGMLLSAIITVIAAIACFAAVVGFGAWCIKEWRESS